MTGAPQEDTALGKTLLIVFLTTWAALLMASGYAQITDPLIRHDDFPALLLIPEDYYEKTLSEGRWLTYFWHLRPFQTSAWLNQQLFQAGWAAYASALAIHAAGTTTLRYPIFIAVLVAFSPQAALISLWFNTLIPGVWAVASYAILTLWLRSRASRLLLLVFVPLTLQFYSTYPLMLFAICLVRQDQSRSIGDLARLTAQFILAFALGLGVIYTLNYYFHGVFGIEMADWRNSNPLESYNDLHANLAKIKEFLVWIYEASGFVDSRLMVVNAALIAASLMIIARYRTYEALYIFTGITAGMGLLILYILLKGVTTPFRATVFLWPLCVIAIVRAAQILGAEWPRSGRLALVAVVYFSGSTGIQVWKHYNSLETWQVETRRLAEQVPTGTKAVYVYGRHLGLPGAIDAKIQHVRALRLRMVYLTGAEIIMCVETPEACEDIVPPFAPQATYSSLIVDSEGSTAFIRLPAIDMAP